MSIKTDVMQLANEEWRDIPTLEGYYQASNFGRVRSVDRWIERRNNTKMFRRGQIMRSCLAGGVMQINFRHNGKYKTFQVHQVVARTFLGESPDENYSQVEHINGNKEDNRVENLRYSSWRAVSTASRELNKGKKVGAYLRKVGGKTHWASQFYFSGKHIFLGQYETEAEANAAYAGAAVLWDRMHNRKA